MTRARALLAAALCASTVLSGCVSVFPKQTPAQLYRFDAAAPGAPDTPGPDGVRAEVVAPPVTVSRASAGDQILTFTGEQAAYIAGARWVAPAAVLWDEAVRRAFATRSTRVRLLSRNELAGGRAFLRLDVPRFEVRYPAPGAAPAAAVTLHALYTHRNGVFAAERTFTATAPAAADSVSAIVAAVDQAVETTAAELLSWSDAHADEAVAEAPSASAAPLIAGPGAGRTTTGVTSTPVRSTRRPSRP